MEGVINDFITVGGKKIPIVICELEQANLKFYPENPRVYSALNSDGTTPSQEDIEEHMKNQDYVRDLADDIKRNDGLMEAIFVRDGDFVVLEGNSRLAAYRILAEKNPIKWGKIKCNLLPKDITEDLIFKLIGQFHIKGKKPWDAYEQACYLYRRQKETKTPIQIIAEELGLTPAIANKMIAAVDLMKEHGESENHNYSYYFEYVKDNSIKKYRETNPELDDVIISQIQKKEIKRAEDIRLLGQIAKVGDKQSKKTMKKIMEQKVTIYQAHEELEENGKFEASVGKLKTFKEYINGDTFEENILSSQDVFNQAIFEIDKIIKRLQQLKQKHGK